MAPLKHHDIIRLRGTGSRKRTWDWLSGRAGGHLCNTREKKRIFVIAITSRAQRRPRPEAVDRYRVCGAHLRWFLPNSAPPTRGFFASYVIDREHSGRPGYHPTLWLGGWG